MSTRSTTHFTYGDESKPVAIVYRHPDGCPDGAGVDIRRVLGECQKLSDPRLDDPSYLAAKYVVFLAGMFNREFKIVNGKYDYVKSPSPLAFISVGVMTQDPEDIVYRYVINCGNIGKDGLPELKCYHVRYTETGADEEVPIPPLEEPQEAA